MYCNLEKYTAHKKNIVVKPFCDERDPKTMNKSNKVKKPSVAKVSTKAASSSLKSQEAKRKQVFRPILDNSFTQSNQWPFIEPTIANDIVDLLEVLLKMQDSTFKYHGFNPTVSALEKQAAANRGIHKNACVQIKYVFVCKYDISPATLTNVFPTLCFTASKSAEDRVKLIQLPRGSLERLSKALGVDRVGIFGLTKDTEGAQPLFDLINENVKDIEAPWLDCIFREEMVFNQPNTKHVASTVGRKINK